MSPARPLVVFFVGVVAVAFAVVWVRRGRRRRWC